jgi:hypothetical protein
LANTPVEYLNNIRSALVFADFRSAIYRMYTNENDTDGQWLQLCQKALTLTEKQLKHLLYRSLPPQRLLNRIIDIGVMVRGHPDFT